MHVSRRRAALLEILVTAARWTRSMRHFWRAWSLTVVLAIVTGPAACGRTALAVGPAERQSPNGLVPAETTVDAERLHARLLAGEFREADREIAAARAGERSVLEAWLRLAAMDWRSPIERGSVPRFHPWRTLAPVELLEAGLRAARAAWPGGDGDMLTVAHEAADALETRGTTEASLFQALVLAAIAAAQEERDLMALALVQAGELDRRLVEAGQALPRSFSVAGLSGDLWLQVHRYDDASEAYAQAVEADPACARAWLGLGRARARLGEEEASRAAYHTFLGLWAGANADRAELSEARAATTAGR